MENAYELKIDNKILKFLTIEGKIYFLKSNVKEMLEEEIEIGEEVSNCQYKELEVIEESMLYIYLIQKFHIEIFQIIQTVMREICPMLNDEEKTLLTLLREKREVENKLKTLKS
jgi:hypothetical protein